MMGRMLSTFSVMRERMYSLLHRYNARSATYKEGDTFNNTNRNLPDQEGIRSNNFTYPC